MYQETIDKFAALAAKKVKISHRAPLSLWLTSMMAGAYVGLGIILIFSIGADVPPEWRRLVMGASFGVALVLVVFAGADLFTGHTMYLPLGWLQGRIGLADLSSVWAVVWFGNLAGAVLLAIVFVIGGGGALLHSESGLLYEVAAYKMNSSAPALVARAMLCNWLVCLALWMAARMDSDTAKSIAIFWCLFAFIASGFEHSVANMTLFAIALLGDPHPAIGLGGMAHNLLWVTLGNIMSGSIFMAGAYWVANRDAVAATEPQAVDAIAVPVGGEGDSP